MAERLYGLTARTAGDVKQLLVDGGAVGGRASSGSVARGVAWVKVTGAASSGWYPGVVSLDEGGTFMDLTTAVKVSAANAVALTTGNRYLCTRTGDDSAGARFRAVAFNSSSGGGGGGGGSDCSWLTAVVSADCWEAVFPEVGTDPIPLPLELEVGGEDESITFDPVTPSLTWKGVVGVLSGCDCPCATFAFKRVEVFPWEALAPDVCSRLYYVKVCQTCCSIPGWGGPGWYCIREAGTDDACEPQELTKEDRCDDTIEICAGPFATQAEAEAECGTVSTACCAADGVPSTLTLTVGGSVGAGSYPMTYDADGPNGPGWYTGSITVGEAVGYYRWWCNGDSWTLSQLGAGGGSGGGGTKTCAPFSYTGGFGAFSGSMSELGPPFSVSA
ncbi:hypothetical protein R5W23_000848 [Gemmata sp. JC673]|uniref:Uncharacterized protein n=1 Tax=Gemmata algarum TaxID=2975278 RepID=A0ABU5ES00_9BACT|nr:hypothetical protein [Gemmata algarum]MDY3558127.1 hypothetical protein [Gemmata algarum]